MKPYTVEIYLPGNHGYDVACSLESDRPFLTIEKGDLINPRAWNSHYAQNCSADEHPPYGAVLRVTGIEHFLFQADDGSLTGHKIGVFTEALSDVAESRPGS